MPPADTRARGTLRFEWILFAFALAVYLVTRLAGITRFPIFFFCDEALQDNLAWGLLHNHFRDETGTFLPPYFLNDRRWAVSLSVYIHLIPVWIFGKSIACVRVTTAAVSLFGVATGGLALKEMRNRFWWSVPLIAGATPLFFVHARLGFETAMMASFYFAFLWAYFLYRTRGAPWIFAAFAFGAATFYAYTGGQGVMLLIGLALLIVDLPYHVRQVRSRPGLFAAAVVFAFLMASPYVRYRRLHPGVVQEQLAVLDSYWTHPIPLSQKLEQFGRNYRAGFDPRYWFRPNLQEVERHRMDGMPFLPPFLVPFIVVGLASCVWNFRKSPLHRAVLLSPLGIPFSAAAASLQILRLMAMVVPATLLAVVGFDWIVRGLARLKIRWAPVAAALALILALTYENVRLTREALEKGPRWPTDYGLFGMQWGAAQIFDAVREELVRSPQSQVLVSSTWSNNPREFLPFFLDDQEQTRVHIGDIRAWDIHPSTFTGNEVFVMTPDEWDIVTNGKKFVRGPDRIIRYPDGKPGFHIAHIRYSPDAPAVFEAERAERAVLQQESATVGKEQWQFEHSKTDMGSLEALFDGRNDTIIRGFEANPFILGIRFPSPRPLREVGLSLGEMDQAHLRVTAFSESGEEKTAELVVGNRPAKDWIDVPIPGAPFSAVRLRIEIRDGTGANPSHVETRELRLR